MRCPVCGHRHVFRAPRVVAGGRGEVQCRRCHKAFLTPSVLALQDEQLIAEMTVSLSDTMVSMAESDPDAPPGSADVLAATLPTSGRPYREHFAGLLKSLDDDELRRTTDMLTGLSPDQMADPEKVAMQLEIIRAEMTARGLDVGWSP